MKNIILILTAFLFITGCTKTPQSCIVADKTIVEVGEPISFSSCAVDAKRTAWNFGDGAVSEETTAQHAFAQPGIYQVQLRVYSNKDKKWDTSFLIINVKEKIRYLKRIQLNSFNINNNNNQTWDANMNTAPDVFIQMGIAGSAIQSQTTTIGELQLNQCPVFWDFSTVGYPQLTNENWRIALNDNDGTLVQPASELMQEFVVNPYTAPSNNNIINLISGNFSIDLIFVE
jgi:PKD repeat protein